MISAHTAQNENWIAPHFEGTCPGCRAYFLNVGCAKELKRGRMTVVGIDSVIYRQLNLIILGISGSKGVSGSGLFNEIESSLLKS